MPGVDIAASSSQSVRMAHYVHTADDRRKAAYASLDHAQVPTRTVVIPHGETETSPDNARGRLARRDNRIRSRVCAKGARS